MPFIVELEPGVWATDDDGDPGRTLDIQFATQFESINDALECIEDARRFRPFPNATLH